MSRPNAPAQRQLNEQGREQAKSIGESLRKLKIPVGLVMTSPIQRAADTARLLGFGDVTATPDLAESGHGDSPKRPSGAQRRFASSSACGRRPTTTS